MVGAVQVLSAQLSDNGFVNIPSWGTYKYYTLTVHTPGVSTLDNVLMDSIQADTPSGVPEPATWMFLAGGAGLILLAGKRFTRG
jgi:hypothetical protein